MKKKQTANLILVACAWVDARCFSKCASLNIGFEPFRLYFVLRCFGEVGCALDVVRLLTVLVLALFLLPLYLLPIRAILMQIQLRGDYHQQSNKVYQCIYIILDFSLFNSSETSEFRRENLFCQSITWRAKNYPQTKIML